MSCQGGYCDMKIFNRTKQQRLQFIVIGCGHFGFPIVRYLTEQDFNVTCIDLEAKTFADMPLSFHECMIEGDGTDPDTLEAAGMDAVVTPIERPTFPVTEEDSNAASGREYPQSVPNSVPPRNRTMYKRTISALARITPSSSIVSLM